MPKKPKKRVIPGLERATGTRSVSSPAHGHVMYGVLDPDGQLGTNVEGNVLLYATKRQAETELLWEEEDEGWSVITVTLSY